MAKILKGTPLQYIYLCFLPAVLFIHLDHFGVSFPSLKHFDCINPAKKASTHGRETFLRNSAGRQSMAVSSAGLQGFASLVSLVS